MKKILQAGLLFSLLLISACQLEEWQPVGPGAYVPPQEPCNGDTSLCGKAYSQVVFPTTLKSYNYELGIVNYLSPSQKYPALHQLQDGIRALSLDVYNEGGQIIVANKNPILGNLLGSEPLVNVLRDVESFLEDNPREVVTLILNTELYCSEIEPAFVGAALTEYLYEHTSVEWLTLETMILSGKRLVVFSTLAEFPNSRAWYNYAYATMFENVTPASRGDWSCESSVGTPTSPMYYFHHRVGLPLLNTSNEDSARAVNSFEVLYNRAYDCMVTMSRRPNFVAVDYYTAGDLFRVCDSLNHLP